jgi:hypothetical protein
MLAIMTQRNWGEQMVLKHSMGFVCGAVSLLILAYPGIARADEPVSCTGPFARDADEAAVRSTFGDSSTSTGEIYIGEGFSETGTVLFPDDPARRIEILWHDPEARARPSAIILRGTSTHLVAHPAKPISMLLAIGASLAVVETANGRPFEILGFDWDYGGTAFNWLGGALAGTEDDCIVSLRFDSEPDAPRHAHSEVSGDQVFLSSDAAMRAVSPTVSSITLAWPE